MAVVLYGCTFLSGFAMFRRLLDLIAWIVVIGVMLWLTAIVLALLLGAAVDLWSGIVSAVRAALPMVVPTVVILSLFLALAWLLVYGFRIPKMPRPDASEGPAGAREG